MTETPERRARRRQHLLDLHAQRTLVDGRWVSWADRVQHGTSSGYVHFACRCAPCREAGAVYQRRRLERYRARLGERTVVHGTVSGYNRDGCRCSRCRAALNAQRQQRRADYLDQRVWVDGSLVSVHPRVVHGTRSGYERFACGCAACRAVGQARQRARRGEREAT